MLLGVMRPPKVSIPWNRGGLRYAAWVSRPRVIDRLDRLAVRIAVRQSDGDGPDPRRAATVAGGRNGLSAPASSVEAPATYVFGAELPDLWGEFGVAAAPRLVPFVNHDVQVGEGRTPDFVDVEVR